MHGRVARWIAGAALLVLLATATSVAIASGAIIGVGQDPTGVPPGGGPPFDGSLTSVLSPSPSSVVTDGRLTVVLRSRAPANAIQVTLNGRRIALGPSNAGGGYRASASLARVLHLGKNLLAVSTNWSGRFDFDAVQFVVARRVGGLAGVRGVLIDGRDAPAVVFARVARGASFRASVNGRDASSAFTRTGDNLVGLLGADDGVRHGSNQLVVTADTSTADSAEETTVARRFDVPRASVIAGVGADRTVLAGQFVKLGGGSSLLAPGASGKSFAWRLASAPRGSQARLLGSTRVKAGFEPDVPGTYRIRLTVSASSSPSAGLGAVSAAALRSTDTVTITAQTNDPYGIPIQSNGPRGAILLDGVAAPSTARNTSALPGISYAVINTDTGKLRSSGQLAANATGLNQLIAVAKSHVDDESLLVFNWIGALHAQRPLLAELFKLVGGGDLPASDQFASGSHPGSVIGVPGAPAGGAFFNHRDIPNVPVSGNMSGYLRLNDVTGLFDFVFTSFVPVDTAPASSATESTITVGSTDYSVHRPFGTSGFQLVTLDPKSLALITNRGYATNSGGGSQLPGTAQLANDLKASADDSRRPLVILQSYGHPKGASSDWDQAALAIQKLGGTRQVFADLNQPFAGGPGGDPTNGRRGGYAFIGRTGGSAPRAEVSNPLDDRPARLRGVLMPTRTADYEPMVVSSVQADGRPPVNEELIRIANQAPTPFPTLAPGASREEVQAAENFLGGPEVMNVCVAGERCDVRRTYYTNYEGSWNTILVVLGHAAPKCRHAAGVDRRVCEQVRQQLFDEVAATNRVRHYLGPQGLQQPFGAAGVAALANLGAISEEIEQSMSFRPGSNAASQALTIISYVVQAASVAGPKVAAVASGIGSLFALAAYLSNEDDAPNLIGPAVRAAATKLGVELAKRYQNAGDQLDGLGRIIVSDYGKLRAVASKVDADPGWIIGSPSAARADLERAAKQTISEALIPVAYPVLYDLGRTRNLNAGSWRCVYGFFTERQKFLFDRNPEGGQVVQRFPGGWMPVMAAGAVRAVGHQGAARIPTPPATVVDPLFKPPSRGGLGMRKLEFYSPRLFKLFPAEPARGRAGSLALWTPDMQRLCSSIPIPPGNSG